MAKYKVGDKVRVRKDLRAFTYCYHNDRKKYPEKDLFFNSTMSFFCGKELTISGFDCDGDYIVSENICYWSDDMFENDSVFTKADLEDGMVVEQRNGDRAVVLNGYFIEYDAFTEFNDYNDDLTIDDSRCGLGRDVHEYDIVKVYTSRGKTFERLTKDRYLDLIWERKEEESHKEMTIEEIEKELGYKIKVVGSEESNV